MLYIFLGCLAFVLLFIFDVFTLKNKRFMKFVFGLGGLALLIYASIKVLLVSQIISFPMWFSVSFFILCGFFLLLLIYSLFIEIPFKKTYNNKEHNKGLITTGTYALCRHPGVIWLFLVYLTLFLATGKSVLFMAGIIWTVVNIIYVALQELFIFPLMFKDYLNYQKETPMLIPNYKSFKRMWKTFRRST